MPRQPATKTNIPHFQNQRYKSVLVTLSFTKSNSLNFDDNDLSSGSPAIIIIRSILLNELFMIHRIFCFRMRMRDFTDPSKILER